MNATKRIAKMLDIQRAHLLANMHAPDFARMSGHEIRKLHKYLFGKRRRP